MSKSSNTTLRTSNDGLLERYDTYLVATPFNRPFADNAPFGVETRWHIDPLHSNSETFLDLLQKLDGLTFGPEGMPMDKWVFFDCSELPGFIYGLATTVDDLTAHEREVFEIPAGYDGPVPLSMYIAIPMHERGCWFGHNLASLNRTFPDRGMHALGTITKSLAMKAYRIERFFGATQWTSKALYIHTKFGPLDLHTAYTPAHSIHETLTYGFEVTDECLRVAAGDPSLTIQRPSADVYLHADDIEAMRTMQAEIEAGAKFTLVGPPGNEAGRIVHPIARVV